VRDLSRRNVIQRFPLFAAFSIAMASQSIAAEKVPMAIKGYDPVAYFTDGKPVRGLPEFEYEWDENRYFFSRAEHRELFKADPVRYAPQFSNFCAMALTRGEVDEANPEYWLIIEGKLYIFGNQTGPNLFQQALTENLIKVNQNRALIHKR
jgi:YHS domain-containing protein